MKRKMAVLFIVTILMIGFAVPIAYACTCNDGHGGGCTGNCCFYQNGVCACLDFGAPGCPKAA
jgi:hypothetical protein